MYREEYIPLHRNDELLYYRKPMEKLIEQLKKFDGKVNRITNEAGLQSLFEELAPAFLYGGYIKVRDDYRVYIKTVEFYFHSEKINGVHDPIVYHRNGRDMEKVPYFPFMCIHAHSSGFDITFESKVGEYRASALIRSYEVKDMHDGKYLKWDAKKCLFEKLDKYCYNNQSTYLYAFLNGFAFGNNNDITWEDAPRDSKNVLGKPRQNVFQYNENKGIYTKTEKRCERKWSFTRDEQI